MEALEQLLQSAARAVGYTIADWELSNHGRFLRVFIEKDLEAAQGGITLSDCEVASRQIQRVLEVEGVDYDRLEVSSPGLDRRLKTAADFRRFRGHKADVELDAEGASFRFDIANLRRARLVPEL